MTHFAPSPHKQITVLAILLVSLVAGCSPRSLIDKDADPSEPDSLEVAEAVEPSSGSEIRPSMGASSPVAAPLAGPMANLNGDREPKPGTYRETGLGSRETELGSLGASSMPMDLPLPDPPLPGPGSPPLASMDGSSIDRASTDPGSKDTGSPDAGSTDTGSTDTGISSTADTGFGTLSANPDDDRTPEDFLDRIRLANQETQRLGRDLSGDQSVRNQLAKVLEVKVAAARKLADAPLATAGQRLVGNRSEIESLSGLAALGSRRATKELKNAAADAIRSPMEPLANDGRVVLIAMAVQEMVRGEDAAADEIVELARPFANASIEVVSGGAAIPILMTLGSAREKLNEYGHGAAADEVRQIISARFAQSPTVEIANLAAEMAGNVSHSEVDQLRAAIVEGETVDVSQWREAVESLIDEAPDLQTVRYLGPLAFEMESLGKDDLADSIYDVLSRRFSDPQSATGIESELAIRLAQRRRDIVGNLYQPQLPSVEQLPLSLTDYRGRVVIMPFWAASNPESLSIVPALQAIQEMDPNAIAIVGMKLDPGNQGDANNEPLAFPSFAASAADQDGSGNPVAIQFGLSTLPFVAVIDKSGRVAGIGYRGEQIKRMVLDALGEDE